MSFGTSAGDIVEAIKIGKWIWTNCFEKDQSADEQYRRFGADIRGLDAQVQELEQVIQTALDELEPFQRQTVNFRQESKEVAGDFLKTLKKCRDLLDKPGNIELRKNTAGIIRKVIWALNVQEKVIELRRHIRFHTQRLSLVVAPVQTRLLTNIVQDLSELVETSRQQGAKGQGQVAEDLVPAWLRDVFQANIFRDTPFDLTTLEEIPLKHGCDALHRHFRHRLTDNENLSTRSQLVLQYLCLLKCRWIITTLSNGTEFLCRRPGSPFRRFISNIDLEICQELQRLKRTRVTEVTESELRDIESTRPNEFLIWEPQKQRQIRSATSKETGEEKLPNIALSNNEQLLVFRKSSTYLRVVPVVEIDGRLQVSPYLKEVELDSKTDALVPRYTVDELVQRGDCPLLEFFRQIDVEPIRYELRDLAAARALQNAVTGYKVVADENDVTWGALQPVTTSSYRSNDRKRLKTGRVQVWKWEPLAEESPGTDDAGGLRSPDSVSTASMEWKRSEIQSQSSFASPPRSSITLSVADSNYGRLAQDAELQPPIPPAILFFGQMGVVHTYCHLEITYDLKVDPTACACEATKGDCRKLVIVREKSSKKFKIQSFSRNEDSIRQWNLSLFRGPGRPYEGVVDEIDCKHLDLEFPTSDIRADFAHRLQIYMKLYRDDYTTYHDLLEQRRYLAERPERLGTGPRSFYSLSTSSRSSSVAASSKAPRLPSISRLSSIRLPFERQSNE